jgi:hypothetical protein
MDMTGIPLMMPEIKPRMWEIAESNSVYRDSDLYLPGGGCDEMLGTEAAAPGGILRLLLKSLR